MASFLTAAERGLIGLFRDGGESLPPPTSATTLPPSPFCRPIKFSELWNDAFGGGVGGMLDDREFTDDLLKPITKILHESFCLFTQLYRNKLRT